MNKSNGPQKLKSPGKQIDFRFRRTDFIGSPVAEQDTLLDEAFEDNGYLSVAKNTKDSRAVVVGRTGSGKTALLLQIERNSERVARSDPLSVALDYLRDHTSIPQYLQLGANLEPFFRFLWRHVLVLEVLKLWQGERGIWGEIREKLQRAVKVIPKSKRRKSVLDYIEEWSGTDLASAGERTRRVINKFDSTVKAGVNWKDGISLSGTRSRETRPMPGESQFEADPNLRKGIQKIVSELSAEHVKTVFDFLKDEVLTDPQKQHYVVIDHLDTAWVDSSYAYDMIQALIDVVGEFAEIPNVKIIVALREDIIASLRQQTGRNRQWEKFENLFLRLRWSDPDLEAMADKRLNLLLKDRYSGPVSLRTLLPAPSKHEPDPVNYVLSRTLQRPRDLIAFVNECIKVAAEDGKHLVTWDIVSKAEIEYSRGRLEALENEWGATYPHLHVVFEAFRGLRGSFTIESLDDGRLNGILAAGERLSQQEEKGPLPLCVAVYQMLDAKYHEMWALIVSTLYEIGFLGVKPSGQEPLTFSYKSSRQIEQPVAGNLTLSVNPTFCRALGIQPNP